MTDSAAPDAPLLPPVPPSGPPLRRPPPLAPWSADELARALRRPDFLLEIVLGGPERLALHAREGIGLAPLLRLLLVAATLFAIPYGCVFGVAAWWKVALLYLGSTLLCVPSLHVFATYLGLGVPLAPLLLLALALPAVAALFTAGFAPILGFLKWTMGAASSAEAISWRDLSDWLLAAALIAGVGQLWRCLAAAPFARRSGGFAWLLAPWLLVFLYVLARMATVLGLW